MSRYNALCTKKTCKVIPLMMFYLDTVSMSKRITKSYFMHKAYILPHKITTCTILHNSMRFV